ncbi:MAG: hypothetical protein AAGE99_00825 [Chlamydiota bacterium]
MERIKSAVFLVGDSTLDNIYWLGADAKKDCIQGQLTEQLGSDFEVINESYDGFTTENVLNGGKVGAVLPSPRDYLIKRFGKSKTFSTRPIGNLKTKIGPNCLPNFFQTHYVVISVGGNDFRVLLSQPWKLLAEIPDVQKRYLRIVDHVQKLGRNIKPIFMFQYRTDACSRPYFICTILGALGYIAATINTLAIGALFYSAYRLTRNRVSATVGIAKIFIAALFLYLSHRRLSIRVTKEIFMGKRAGLAVFGAMLERLYPPMIKKAIEDGIPILDLPNLFNPLDPELFICEIEPSKKGGALIATRLAEIVKAYDWAAQETKDRFKDWRVEAL